MSNQLLDYVQSRAGDYFRGLATYDDHDVTIKASRPDLDPGEMKDRAKELRLAIRPQGSFKATETLGKPRAIVQIRDHAVVLHFPIDANRGYLIGLEPEAARDLNEFIEECSSLIDGRSSTNF